MSKKITNIDVGELSLSILDNLPLRELVKIARTLKIKLTSEQLQSKKIVLKAIKRKLSKSSKAVKRKILQKYLTKPQISEKPSGRVVQTVALHFGADKRTRYTPRPKERPAQLITTPAGIIRGGPLGETDDQMRLRLLQEKEEKEKVKVSGPPPLIRRPTPPQVPPSGPPPLIRRPSPPSQVSVPVAPEPVEEVIPTRRRRKPKPKPKPPSVSGKRQLPPPAVEATPLPVSTSSLPVSTSSTGIQAGVQQRDVAIGATPTQTLNATSEGLEAREAQRVASSAISHGTTSAIYSNIEQQRRREREQASEQLEHQRAQSQLYEEQLEGKRVRQSGYAQTYAQTEAGKEARRRASKKYRERKKLTLPKVKEETESESELGAMLQASISPKKITVRPKPQQMQVEEIEETEIEFQPSQVLRTGARATLTPLQQSSATTEEKEESSLNYS